MTKGANNNIDQLDNDIKEDILKSLHKWEQLQREKKTFNKMDQDSALLSPRCLPLINQAMNVNKTALRIREYDDKASQVDCWEVEWNDEWSNASMQTEE